MKHLTELGAKLAALLIILGIIIYFAEMDGYQRARSKYDIPQTRDSSSIEIDTTAIILRAKAGMIRYDPESERKKSATLARAEKEVARLNAWMDSLSSSMALDSIHSDTLPSILFPTLEADTVVTWAGEDTVMHSSWTADLDHHQIIIPLLGEIRNTYQLDLEFYYPPAETTYIDHGGNSWTWWEKGAVGLGIYLGWKLRSDL